MSAYTIVIKKITPKIKKLQEQLRFYSCVTIIPSEGTATKNSTNSPICMRKLIVSKWVRNKIDELESYLKNNLKLSTEVTHRYSDRIRRFVRSLSCETNLSAIQEDESIGKISAIT